MAAAFPPSDLECPHPAGCPVPTTLPQLHTITVDTGTAWYRAYDATWGYDEPNPGYGDARFSPIDDPGTSTRLPSIYLAATRTGALLETVFHEVHHLSSRTIYERDLRGKLLAHVRTPAPAVLCDLRDPALLRLGLEREAVVSTSAEHYPCTRRLAVAALAQPRRTAAHGLIWHSRQAELSAVAPVEVMVLFGKPRYHQRRGAWTMFGPGASSLYDGAGRLLIEEVAENLGAIIELDS